MDRRDIDLLRDYCHLGREDQAVVRALTRALLISREDTALALGLRAAVRAACSRVTDLLVSQELWPHLLKDGAHGREGSPSGRPAEGSPWP